MWIKIVIVLFSALSIAGLAGCNMPNSETIDADKYRAEWHDLKDGSKFAIAPLIGADTLPPDRQTAVRCWQTGAAAYLCLDATKSTGDVRSLSLNLNRREELPTLLFPAGWVEGYSCFAMRGTVTEEIRRGGSLLSSNRVGPTTAPWSRSFVQQFMRENDVPGEWFDCEQLLHIVHAGSLETMSTTAVRRSMLPD
ncbi:MAG: hypothetical protein K2X31_03240 [Sphingopyxis sp.]|nr:hypothetical protein [Sphingopyxis sp.]